MSAKTVGALPCYVCKREIPVLLTDGGTYSLKCGWCGFSAYAKDHTSSHKRIGAEMTREGIQEAPTESPEVPSAPTPTQKKKKPARAFDLSQLVTEGNDDE